MSESLWPREHGAYAQLIFPILSGLLLGRPGVAAFGFAAAAILLFLAHEPALILLGFRGARRRRELRVAARARLLLLLPAGIAAGLAAFWMATPESRVMALLPGGLVVALVPLVMRHQEKSIPGEFLVATALASLHALVGHAAGLRGAALWGPAVLWLSIYVVATVAVHAVRARQAANGGGLRALSIALAVVAFTGSVVMVLAFPPLRWLGLAALLPTLALLVVNLSGVTVRRLKQIGWTLVAGQVVALYFLIFAPGRPG